MTKVRETWIFNSGNDFSGNVKYMFLYVNKHCPNIDAIYLCDKSETISKIKSLGFKAYKFDSLKGKAACKEAAVYVTEQCKEKYQLDLFRKDIKILNLWHGVGLKAIERKYIRDALMEPLSRKYIRYNQLYRNNMLFLVTSDFMKIHFKDQLDLRDEQVIEAGYPRCTNLKLANTYNHDILKERGLSPDTKIAVYAPTWREDSPRNFLYKAIKDVYRLIDVLKKTNTVLILKLHPKINNDFYFENFKVSLANEKHIILWDNDNDIYEIFDQVDIAIVDYSSIFYDLLAAGVKKFVRYIFDYEQYQNALMYDYASNTTGVVCKSFEDLVDVLEHQEKIVVDENDLDRLNEKFFGFNDGQLFEKIIEQTNSFVPSSKEWPTFYSFDIFDTLLARECHEPKAIFHYVMKQIRKSNLGFPDIFSDIYPEIRGNAEANAREEKKKTIGHYEITFNSIFEKMSQSYPLTDLQKEQLKSWEIEAEIENVLPIKARIDFLKELLEKKETVVLISDMYLPRNVIEKMLERADPVLATLPLYLSSEQSVQKTTKKLYLKVYQDYSPWMFGKWNHYGDNSFADGKQAKALGIDAHLHKRLTFNKFENYIWQRTKSYDSYLLAGMIARYRTENQLSNLDYYSFAHVSAYLAGYVNWVVEDALKNDVQTLYFISRDGFLLKNIADKVIEVSGLKIKTKYIYGSRKAWRIPSLIDCVDDEFFSPYGNIVGIKSYNDLLKCLEMSDEQFRTMFPELQLKNKLSGDDVVYLRDYFKKSQAYHEYILSVAAERRSLVDEYLRQEINFDEKYAFVEYWGRGYTQTCMTRLLNSAAGNNAPSTCYYYRSIYSSDEMNIRKNFSTNCASLVFIESLFSNLPTETVKGYKKEGGRVVPVFDGKRCNEELLASILKYTAEFVEQFNKTNFKSQKEAVARIHSDCALWWWYKQPTDSVFVPFGSLTDCVTISGEMKAYAPPLSYRALFRLLKGKPMGKYTKNVPISLAQSSPMIKFLYRFLKNVF